MRTIGLEPSFGFGDRTGLATAGHVLAWRDAGRAVAPIFAQQSIREMDRTGRTPETVIADAERGMTAILGAGHDVESGADADHLKTSADIAATVSAGFRMFTLDPSDHVDDAALGLDLDAAKERVRNLGDDQRWFEEFRGRTVELDSGTKLELDEITVARTLARVGAGLRRVLDLGESLGAAFDRLGAAHPTDRSFEIEVSLDETAIPTSLAEHWIVASVCLDRGLPLVSVAPRFPGAFEKGVDHRGDRAELERAVHDHAAVSRALGGHKLSLHSGSDKLSVYGLLARATAGRCHVKTAGTTWLEGLRVVARRQPQLFRRIIDFARDRYEEARVSYELSAELKDAPPSDAGTDRELEVAYLGDWDEVPDGMGFTGPGRQIVHCTYGHVWQDEDLGPEVRQLLEGEPALHQELVAAHFGRHLAALQKDLP